MSEESATEKAPQFSTKAKRYMAGSFGLICLLFIISIVVEKLTIKPDTPETVTATTTDSSKPVNVTSQTFNKVRDERQKAAETADVLQSNPSSDTGFSEITSRLAPNLIEQEKENMAALEFKRAALASRSTWGLIEPETINHITSPTASTTSYQNSELPDNQLSSDDQRQMIAKRLKDVAILKQQIQAGNYSAFEAQEKTQTLTSLENGFSPPPPEIVGFTDENQYNASTEGLLKIPIGTIIPAITVTKANSDITGTFKAMVSQDVFDVTGEYVLVPKGSEVILKSVRISNPNEVINPRVGTTVPWIILPNGNKIDFSKSTGLDREGLAGISDQVDRHLLEQFLGVAAYALVANETSYSGSGANNDSSYEGEVSQGLRDQASPLAQKYLALTATNTIRTGQSMNVIVEEEIYLKPWRHIYEDYL